MNRKTAILLASLLLPLLFGSLACDNSSPTQMPCVPGPGYGTVPSTGTTGGTTVVHGTYTCGPNGEKTFTPDTK